MSAYANTQSQDNAYNQAQAQAASIEAMVAALNVDYDHLEELRDELESLEYDVEHAETDEEKKDALEALAAWRAEYSEELKGLEDQANGNKDQDEASDAIRDDPLEVAVRSDWHTPGAPGEEKPTEFKILLCTGGPAVRIMGELDEHQYPRRAWIEAQDWFKPWSECVGIIDQDVLLTYCQQFYFGE